MNIKAILDDHIRSHDLCPGAVSFEQWSRKDWLEVRIEDKLIRAFPMWPIRDALSKHDLHHILTGYSTSMKGEAELAAWELGSGGCHLNLIFWIDRVIFLAIGLLSNPAATVKALLRGIKCRNLFCKNLGELLDQDEDHVRRYMNL